MVFVIIIIFTLNQNVFAQTYHDCTSTQGFENFTDQNSNSEEMLDLMELEFAKSLSKFDKCVDRDYSDFKNKEDRNELENSEKGKKSVEETAERNEQDEASSGEESAEKKEKEFESPIEELSEKKQQEIEKAKERSKKVNNDYNDFSDQNTSEEFLNNKKTSNNKIVNSVASSELSGTEVNRENVEEVSAYENDTSEDSTEYENTQGFEQTEENNAIIPKDIPQDDNDSVLEEQIKLAAMNEKDPEKKKRLWNEYRKYKGLPQKE